MKVIALPPKEGKTRAAIKLSARTGATLVVRDEEAIDMALWQATELGVRIPRPISYFDATHQRYAYADIKSVIIDDVDEFLHLVLGAHVEAITYTVHSDDENR